MQFRKTRYNTWQKLKIKDLASPIKKDYEYWKKAYHTVDFLTSSECMINQRIHTRIAGKNWSATVIPEIVCKHIKSQEKRKNTEIPLLTISE